MFYIDLRYFIGVFLILFFFIGCGQKYKSIQPTKNNYESLIIDAESKAQPSAKKVLQKAKEMTLIKREIIRGSCWDYIDTVYTRVGFLKNRRKIIYKSRKKGPFADLNMIQAGDWIYHINYSYHKVGHSGIFIGWVDRQKKLALILSYAGERRKTPARYKVYDLSSVYHITRAD